MGSQFDHMSRAELIAALRALEFPAESVPAPWPHDRVGLLSAASDVLGSSFDYSATLARVAEMVVPTLGDVCAFDIRQPDGKLLRVAMSHARKGDREVRKENRFTPPLLDKGSPLAKQLAAGKPIVVPDKAMHLPLIGRKGIVGVMTLAMTSPRRPFIATDLATASDLAARVAFAIDSTHLYRDANRAVALREDILSFVSHDLKNPLLAMWLSTESMIGQTPALERRRGWKHLDRIRRGILEMRHTIEDLLDWASLDAGKLSIVARPQDAGDLLDEAVLMLSPMAATKQISIVVDPPPEPCWVRCDPERTMRVLSNLTGNAVKFTPTGGSVALSVRAAGTQAVIAVQDSGPGIAPDLLPSLFERHRQAKATARLGHGLGLYISKAMVEAQGGRIWAENRPESGAAFYFTLPLC